MPAIADEDTTTNAAGRYSLPVPSSAAAESLAKSNGGVLNYTISAIGISGPTTAATSEGLAVSAVPGSFVANASSSLVLGATSTLGPAVAGATRASATLHLAQVKAEPLPKGPTPGPAIAVSSDPATWGSVSNLNAPVATDIGSPVPASSLISKSINVTPAVACGSGWIPLSYQTDMEPVTELHAYLDQNVQGQYVNQANSDFNAGFQPAGGGWSANGTYHIGNSGSFGFNTAVYQAPGNPPYAFGHWMYSQFQYVEEEELLICGGQQQFEGYGIFPLTWQGGGVVGGPDVSSWDGYYGNGQGAEYQIPAGNYSEFGPGFTAWKNTARAYNYGGSIGAFGVSLGGSSAYSTNMQITWHMGTAFSGYYLFGHDGPPPNATIVYSW